MKTFRIEVTNSGKIVLGVSLEIVGMFFEVLPSEKLIFEAYDFEPEYTENPVLDLVFEENFVTVYALEGASVRVIKAGEVIYVWD